ncbi:MAG: hypothetical protein ACJ8HC_26930, partial [Paraburkholderia graminis]|uniref:hypothetical protein n=1 Tax=Paraburkholderia graminis TaxID=60548 RepID=UPI00389AFCAC
MNIAHATIKGAIRAVRVAVMDKAAAGGRRQRGHYCTCTVRFVNTTGLHAALFAVIDLETRCRRRCDSC